MGHHHHHHHHQPDQDGSVGRLFSAFLLNFVFAIIEFIGGIAFQSMSVMADAIHDLGDSLSLGLALVLQKKSQKKANQSFTYGYKRYSAAGAFINSIVLIVGSTIIIWEAFPRIWEPSQETNGLGMMGLAVLGIVVNSIAAWRLSGDHSHNEKVISLHLLEDILGWVAVLIGAVIIYFFKWYWVDPLLALLISIFILKNVWQSFTSSIRIFLQSIPDNIPIDQIRSDIASIEGVTSLNDFHAWTLDGQDHVCTCVVEIAEQADVQIIKASIRQQLRQFNFRHVTIEIAADKEDHCH